MKSEYPDDELVQTVSAQISWSHNIAIIDKVKDQQKRIWYINQSYANGWSHDVLIHQIETDLYGRQALPEKVSNFPARLPSSQSDLATQMMKDPYVFDFIPFKADIVERDIEQALIADVTKLLLELGTGFAFLGNQYHLNVGGDDFYIDLAEYSLRDVSKPIGISEYRVTSQLPENLQSQLPSVEDLRNRIGNDTSPV